MDASKGTTRVGATLRRRAPSLGLFAAALFLVAAAPAWAETRVALVIGNGGYRSVPELANPPNDARDVADALKALGFAVTLGVDLDQARMQRAIDDFARSAATADVSLFYYGGHGLQVAAHNYLIPVDAELRSVDDIDKRTIRLDGVLEGAGEGERNPPRLPRRLPQQSAQRPQRRAAHVGSGAGRRRGGFPDRLRHPARQRRLRRRRPQQPVRARAARPRRRAGDRRFVDDDRGAPRRHRRHRRRADPVGEFVADAAVLFRRRDGGRFVAGGAAVAPRRRRARSRPAVDLSRPLSRRRPRRRRAGRCSARSARRQSRRRRRRAPTSRTCCGAWR